MQPPIPDRPPVQSSHTTRSVAAQRQWLTLLATFIYLPVLVTTLLTFIIVLHLQDYARQQNDLLVEISETLKQHNAQTTLIGEPLTSIPHVPDFYPAPVADETNTYTPTRRTDAYPGPLIPSEPPLAGVSVPPNLDVLIEVWDRQTEQWKIADTDVWLELWWDEDEQQWLPYITSSTP